MGFATWLRRHMIGTIRCIGWSFFRVFAPKVYGAMAYGVAAYGVAVHG